MSADLLTQLAEAIRPHASGEDAEVTVDRILAVLEARAERARSGTPETPAMPGSTAATESRTAARVRCPSEMTGREDRERGRGVSAGEDQRKTSS
jgi:hypothetical protein